jgi:dienelactone hydrolase
LQRCSTLGLCVNVSFESALKLISKNHSIINNQTRTFMETKSVLKIIFLFVFALMCNTIFAQDIIKLWDGPAPGSENWTQKETAIEYLSPFWHEKNIAVFNVVEPTLTVFQPAPGKTTGSTVIVCPGGGFTALSWDTEGPNVARKLAEKGITAFVLKYRVGYSGGTPQEVNLICQSSYGGQKRTPEVLELIKKNTEISQSMSSEFGQQDTTKLKISKEVARSLGNIIKMATNDGRRAIEYVRKNASKWNLNPDKIGIMGFSAGGMLTLEVAFNHTEQNKPNFIGVIYGSMGFEGVPNDPMPMFMASSQNEAIGGAAALYASWCDAKLPAEIHSFTDSRHGFGYRNNGDSVNIWIELFCNFLKKTGFIK